MAVKVDINTIEQYSARKKNTKIIELCSVKNPATNSLSASGRSKGVRLVSASADTKKIIASGRSGTTNQTACWWSISIVILNVPVRMIIVRIAELKINS